MSLIWDVGNQALSAQMKTPSSPPDSGAGEHYPPLFQQPSEPGKQREKTGCILEFYLGYEKSGWRYPVEGNVSVFLETKLPKIHYF